MTCPDSSWKTGLVATKNLIWRWMLGQQSQQLNFMTNIGMIERYWDVARIQTNPPMYQTVGSAWLKWEESGRKVEWPKIIWRDFCPNRPFFGKQSNISPLFVMLACKCLTWLESCWKGRFLDKKSFGLSLILWAQGILSPRDLEADPLAYTAS